MKSKTRSGVMDDPLIQRVGAAIAHFGFEPSPGRSSTDANTPSPAAFRR